MKSDLIDKKKIQFVINSFTQLILSFNLFHIVKFLPEDFFQVLLGLKKSCSINLEINIIKTIQILIFYLRLISGMELYLVKKNDNFFFINIDDNFNKNIEKNKFLSYRKFVSSFVDKYIYEDLTLESNFKFIFLDNIYNRKIIQIESQIKNVVILTHNRPEKLKNVIEEYINNFYIFGFSNIKMTISDDSNEDFYIRNREIIKSFNYDIEHLYLHDKNNIINLLKRKYLNNLELINYIFGNGNYNTNVARNRNFISFLFKNKDFISLDDDSRPLVLTYSIETINDAINKMFYNNDFELINIKNYIRKYNYKKIFLPVNFIGNFSNYDNNLLKSAKYSGIEDDSSFYQIAKLFFYYLGEIKEINTINTFTEKFMNKKLQGLCIYFPTLLNNYRYTLPEVFRLEDTIIGINYYNETSTYPISSNFAIYHEKNISIDNITYIDLKNEIISTLIFLLYEKNFFLNNDEYKYIKIPNKVFEKLQYEINLTYNLFVNFYNKFVNLDLKISNFIANLLNLIKKDFIDYDYRNNVEKYINNILKKYFDSYKLWKLIINE